MQALWEMARPYSPLAPIRARPPRRDGAAAARVLEIERVARQMARVAGTVPWGRVQDDRWDRHSRFIYTTRSAETARRKAQAVAAEIGDASGAFVQYALRRWYCFWGSRLAEMLFLGHAGVRPGPPRHHEIDFTIDGVPFDLKTTEVPRPFRGPVEAWQSDPGKLAAWLYTHQSRERRFHCANRLFLVLCDPIRPDEAWRLRGDVRALSAAIGQLMVRRRFIDLIVDDGVTGERRVSTAVVPVLPVEQGVTQLELRLGTRRATREGLPRQATLFG